jgi:hypothetical protein
MELTGDKPTIHVASGAVATFALAVLLPDGTPVAPGDHTAATHPHLVTGGGMLRVETRSGR